MSDTDRLIAINLDDSDLAALFAYLQSLPGAPGGPDPKVRQVMMMAQKE